MAYIIIATIMAKEGQAEKLKEHLEAVKADVKKNEPGTLQYQTIREVEDPNTFTVFEEYDSYESHMKHREGKAYLTFKDALSEIAAGGIKIVKYEAF